MNRTSVPYSTTRLHELAQLLIGNIRELAQPARTAGHQQQLLAPPGRPARGHHRLRPRQGPAGRRRHHGGGDFDGRPVGRQLRPSAETLLHTAVVPALPEIGCVLHTHSPVQTVASRLYADQGHIRLEGYELLKAFEGNRTHEMAIDVPVFTNTQDMDASPPRSMPCWTTSAPAVGYLKSVDMGCTPGARTWPRRAATLRPSSSCSLP